MFFAGKLTLQTCNKLFEEEYKMKDNSNTNVIIKQKNDTLELNFKIYAFKFK